MKKLFVFLLTLLFVSCLTAPAMADALPLFGENDMPIMLALAVAAIVTAVIIVIVRKHKK